MRARVDAKNEEERVGTEREGKTEGEKRRRVRPRETESSAKASFEQNEAPPLPSHSPRAARKFLPSVPHGDRLQLEMATAQERTCPDEFPRRQILGREIRPVGGVE